MASLHTNPVFARLADARHALVAGAGGGFDIYAGLPLALTLLHQGKEVHLANLSFSALAGLPADDWAAPDLAVVTADSAPHQGYFPERTLAQWLRGQGYPATVHAFPRVGVVPLRAAYRALIEPHAVDAVVLVDGGTDILLRGDEAGLGTPEEDMTSVATLAALDGVPGRAGARGGLTRRAFGSASAGERRRAEGHVVVPECVVARSVALPAQPEGGGTGSRGAAWDRPVLSPMSGPP